MGNFELLFALFNQYVFQDAKNHLEDLRYYYNTNPETSGNPLVHELLDAVNNYSLESIDLPLFRSILNKVGKTEFEANEILGKVIEAKRYDKAQVLPYRQMLNQISAKALIQKANYVCKNDASEFVKYIKNSNFTSCDTSLFSSTNFSNLDINSILADQSKGIIKSRYKWINDSFEPYHGFERGQIVLVVAPPSTGKSLFLMSEALYMATNGHKVLYIGLGDNKERDFVIRMGAIHTGLSFGEATENLAQVYNLLRNDLQNNLEISVNPADKISATDIVEYVKSHPEFEVIMIDYDSNLKGASDGDSMYNTFGAIYGELTELSLGDKLLYIAAQPKVASWDRPVIQMSEVGESSRKQHSADVIITISRESECPNHLHTCYIAKNRRGENTKAYAIRLSNGRFIEIPRELYDILREERELKRYSEGDIDVMIERCRQSTSALQQTINNVTGGNGSRPAPPPSFQRPQLNPFQFVK